MVTELLYIYMSQVGLVGIEVQLLMGYTPIVLRQLITFEIDILCIQALWKML